MIAIRYLQSQENLISKHLRTYIWFQVVANKLWQCSLSILFICYIDRSSVRRHSLTFHRSQQHLLLKVTIPYLSTVRVIFLKYSQQISNSSNFQLIALKSSSRTFASLNGGNLYRLNSWKCILYLSQSENSKSLYQKSILISYFWKAEIPTPYGWKLTFYLKVFQIWPFSTSQ